MTRRMALKMLVSLPLVLGLVAVAVASNGSARLDPPFGENGRVFVPANPLSEPLNNYSSAVTRDGRGRLIGATGAGFNFLVARYLPNGRLDPRFGGGDGLVHVPWAPSEDLFSHDAADVNAVAIDPNGRILIAGGYALDARQGDTAFGALARLNPNGSLDQDFGDHRPPFIVPPGPGRAYFDGLGLHQIYAVAATGKNILIGGETSRGYVARLTPRGGRDFDFGHNGVVSFVPRDLNTRGVEARITGLRRLGSGKIIASGVYRGDFLVSRLTQAGKFDKSFGRGGKVTTNASSRRRCRCSAGQGLDLGRHGRILVSGFVHPSDTPRQPDPNLPGAMAVARYLPNGDLDGSFGQHGVVRTQVRRYTYGRGVVAQRDGRIVIVGRSSRTDDARDPRRLTIVRYLPSGKLDRSFFRGGVARLRLGTISSEGSLPIIDRTGRIVVAATGIVGKSFTDPASNRGLLLARFRPG